MDAAPLQCQTVHYHKVGVSLTTRGQHSKVNSGIKTYQKTTDFSCYKNYFFYRNYISTCISCCFNVIG